MLSELSITVEDLLAREPCWEAGDILEVAQHLTVPATARTLLRELPQRGVSAEEVLWVVLDVSLIPAATLREFACRCAERALTREREAGREPDPRNWEAVRVARAYANGEAGDEELAAARAAAWDAAESAARAAAWTAMDATWAAARAAAEAARTATWTARDADSRAAEAAEGQWQLEELTRMVEVSDAV